MSRKVALLHTSFVFIQRERMLFDILEELLPDVELINIVDDGMLREVIATSTISSEVIKRMCYFVLAAEAIGVDAIFNTCSSLGPAFDVAKKMVSVPTIKIDEGMAEKAAREGNRIAVMATVPTTLKPTTDLIREKSTNINKDIETREALCEGAFDLLMKNQVEEHDAMVAQTARGTAQWADMSVLAQCSMARLAPRLEEEVSLPVLSSPRLGVELLRDVLGR